MRKLPGKLLGALLALIFVLFAMHGARAGELDTTWRVGDLIHYRFACHTMDDAVDVSDRTPRDALKTFREFMKEGRCIALAAGFPAALNRYITGGFDGDGRGTPASVWEILDIEGDIEYILVPDENGPHQPIGYEA